MGTWTLGARSGGQFRVEGLKGLGIVGFRLGIAPHTVTVYNRATIKGLICLH